MPGASITGAGDIVAVARTHLHDKRRFNPDRREVGDNLGMDRIEPDLVERNRVHLVDHDTDLSNAQ